MKVFVSWSGDLSKRLGEAIRDWLPGVLQAVTPYFTPSDIEKGTRWSTDIAKELEESQVGILCITQDNIHSEWIMFEAGALSKRLDKSHVCPILFGITNTDLAGPLKQFQTTEFERKDFHKLLGIINGQLGELKLPPKTLDIVFEKWWPDLETRVQAILGDVKQADKPIRSDRELLEEILQLNRASVRRGGHIPEPVMNAAIADMLEAFINLHDQQAGMDGGYQEALDLLKKLGKSVGYIAKKHASGSENVANLLEVFSDLSYETPEDARVSDDEDPPF